MIVRHKPIINDISMLVKFLGLKTPEERRLFFIGGPVETEKVRLFDKGKLCQYWIGKCRGLLITHPVDSEEAALCAGQKFVKRCKELLNGLS